MTNAFIEPSKTGGFQIEFSDHQVTRIGFITQEAAIAAAKSLGHKPLVARVRERNNKGKPDHWRSAD